MDENQKRNYKVKDILNIFKKLENVLGGIGVIDYIAINPKEFSIYINQGVSVVLVNELEKLKDIVNPDSVFFNENHPQLIVANTAVHIDDLKDNDMIYSMKFANDCAEFICPCTGSEIHLLENEIRIYIDQNSLLHNEYIGVYDLLDNEDQFVFKTVLDLQRPYLSIMSLEDVFNE